MYNILDKLRSGEPLSAKDRTIHEQGVVSVLRQLHDELDEAVLQAYGWSDLLPLLRIAMGLDVQVPRAPKQPLGKGTEAETQSSCRSDVSRDPPNAGNDVEVATNVAPTMKPGFHHAIEEPPVEAATARGPSNPTRDDAKRAFDETILERLVALNAQRAAAEARGDILWLRPEFQNPNAHAEPEQRGLDTTTDQHEAAPVVIVPFKPTPWPKDTVDQVRAVADLLAVSPVPLSLDEIAARFTARGPWKKRLPKLVEMLVALGRAQEQDGKVVAA